MPAKILSFLRRYWLVLAAGALVLVCLKDIMAAYNFYWSDKDGYYTHAPLVPLVFGYMVWKNRYRLNRNNSPVKNGIESEEYNDSPAEESLNNSPVEKGARGIEADSPVDTSPNSPVENGIERAEYNNSPLEKGVGGIEADLPVSSATESAHQTAILPVTSEPDITSVDEAPNHSPVEKGARGIEADSPVDTSPNSPLEKGIERDEYNNSPLEKGVRGIDRLSAEHKGGWIGVLLTLIGALGVLSALVIQAETLAGPAIILLLFAVVWGIMGWKAAKILLFPIIFLYTVIPLPPGMLDGPTGKLQLMSSTIAANIMQLTGIDVVRQGNIIESNSLPTSLQVAGVCSGLKLLISALMFSLFFAYVTNSAWWKKIALVALAFPLSIIINSLRVVTIGYAGVWSYSDVTMSKVHDWSATPALIVCFMLFLLFAKLLKANKYHDFDARGDVQEKPSTIKFTPAAATVFGILLLASLYASLVADLNEVPKGKLDPRAMPVAFSTWSSEEAAVDQDTKDKLAKADLLSRFYVNHARSSAPILVFISTAIDPIALHDPHTCLPGGGLRIVSEQPMDLTFNNPNPVTVKATLLTTQDEIGTEGYILHWYQDISRTYPDTRTMNIGYFNRRMSDLGQVFLRPFAAESIKQEVFSRQIRWYRFSTDETEGGNVEYLKKFIKEFMAAGKSN